MTRRRYTDDFKARAIALAEPIGRAKAARQLDMSVKTLGNWADASRAGVATPEEAHTSVQRLRAALDEVLAPVVPRARPALSRV
ncbi:transposase [Xanthomonas arboricola]|uniref:transposase n=1 Tax=Xanthomonas arboricola TaxID=56448 RepID=UPI0021550692|nr:transposase [Xanthomonas arboricola]